MQVGDGSLNYQANGLPGGLSINSNTGLISGTISSSASASSPFFVTVTVDDSDANPGDVQNINFNWDVFNPAVGVPIVLSSISNQSSYEGNTPTLQVNASGGDGSLTYQASGLPSGLTINSSNGLISGTISSGATSGSPYSVTVTVDDADGFHPMLKPPHLTGLSMWFPASPIPGTTSIRSMTTLQEVRIHLSRREINLPFGEDKVLRRLRFMILMLNPGLLERALQSSLTTFRQQNTKD
ncbi:MAG: Ig domain-containing protein [Bacteroidia bacterium]